LKILQVSLKPPYPKVDGGCIAIAAMTESLLLTGAEVKLLTMETDKHPFSLEKFPVDIASSTAVESVFIDTRIKPLDALFNLFDSSSYNVNRFYSKAFAVKLQQLLETSEFDIIHLESIFCTPYLSILREYSKAKIVVRAHNVEFKIWKLLAENEANPIKKWYLNLLAKRLERYEVNMLKNVNGVVAITEEDKKDFKTLGVDTPSEVVPIGIAVYDTPSSSLDETLSLYHLGAMDWAPNVEAVVWFLNEVWPLINKSVPEATAHFAGRKMPAPLLSRSNENLIIEGEVVDAAEFISDKNIAIIPIQSGSGIRVKIIEALANGKVVITTSLGATGIKYEDGINLLIANTPIEFVEKLQLLKNEPSLIQTIGSEARKLAEKEYDLKNLSSKLIYFYGKL